MTKSDPHRPAAEPSLGLADSKSGGTPPLRNWMDPRLDFSHTGELKTSYVVASSYRSGSTFLCWHLWQTGALGAPAEYLNVGNGRQLRDAMMRRLSAVSPEDYLRKLFARRTSRNGVFGLKAHFHHFDMALRWYPALLDVLRPALFVLVTRQDEVAQAVSMARSLQSDVWTSLDRDTGRKLHFDAALIDRCLAALRQQHLDWVQWFDAHGIEPLVVRYEDLLSDAAEVADAIVERLGTSRDDPHPVRPPVPQPQSDAINLEWALRFKMMNAQLA